MDTDTETPQSDPLEAMTREQLLVAAQLYRTIANQRLKHIQELDVRLQDARRARR